MKARPIIFPPSSDLTAKLAELGTDAPVALHALSNPELLTGPTLAEQEALVVLLRGPQPVILCPARSLARMRLKPEYRTPLAEGRLLLLSPFAETIRRATVETAVRRNRFVAALADQVLIAYADPGGKTAQLAEDIAGWGKPVITLGKDGRPLSTNMSP